jgi:transcriptional regulator with XRE-family HTH domain
MGRGKQENPKRIAEKLRDIRLKLGLTQEATFDALIEEGANIHPGYISLYEIGQRVPGLLVVLAYARIAGISTDALIDDNLDIPERLPAK